ncbi:glycoside hydrolase family 1 protein [Commensalibacter papalotli (ex Botero et al. 2024)]|uniref:beta-glucosidase n=1 Tax=Commensalibacter papalotli (ex Botero et al. 2024) TaxID=2972766 RepID=A0ABN8W8C8_9PROT|nr:family 1 glycosylhydrolase [Commensalibacter papalotli (ex Botero et al. 2024)]CAI3923064.1 Beta-glucosidase/6-phospho-beta-glucosidase/beta-galactosidase (BglB) (PDB:4HZ6) [Commensalibacter papalotli (ex Botero et al. 2024)]CAI3929088.1 Beta-glucosidase/6-phospho-beta-glucosidase/beta-galactosidase (BglB) (PDB:4HZ6) [Commensalibacter papalotli (ex Botero et al. 2024)]
MENQFNTNIDQNRCSTNSNFKIKKGFLWGAASAAYQVEGCVNEEGRGKSIWDYYLNEKQLGGLGVTGDVSINFYDRNQYLEDIQLLKKVKINCYRFSISWPRIIPDGLGPVNMKAVEHYRRFIADLKAAGISSLVTLYHWDMPLALANKGGWENRDCIDWFNYYAQIIFTHFSDLIQDFVLINEPSVEVAQNILAKRYLAGDFDNTALPVIATSETMEVSLKSYNHILLAAAKAKESFRAGGYKGRLGMALPLSPILTDTNASAADKADAKIADGVLNRWFLDAIYKGQYPEDILSLVKSMNIDIGVQAEDAKTIQNAQFEFLGINFYAPNYVRHGKGSGYNPETFIPVGQDAAFNGPVRPDQLTALLDRIRTEYGNPTVLITENGAGFPGEDQLINGKVEDTKRSNYIQLHIEAMILSMQSGSNIDGYMVWSSHDNLEWFSGYKSRFGMIYVDWQTQKRTLKQSAYLYSNIIKEKR